MKPRLPELDCAHKHGRWGVVHPVGETKVGQGKRLPHKRAEAGGSVAKFELSAGFALAAVMLVGPGAAGAQNSTVRVGKNIVVSASRPLFFEVHRLGVFTPRSLDVDVIYDLMIHDLDILLALVHEPVTEVKAVGIPVLTDKVDIAHARLEFAGGAVANITASRVSTERVRKMRFFQQHEYISLDYARRDALRIGVKKAGPRPEFGFEKLNAPAVEPLHAQLEAFVDAARSRKEPRTNGAAGRAALELAGRVMASIQEHATRVNLLGGRKTAGDMGARKEAGLDVFARYDKTR